VENRVGDKTPSTAEIQKQIKTVNDLINTISKYCVGLLPDERQSLTRSRLGIEPHLSRMALVAKKFGFNVPGASPDALLNDVRTTTDLAPLEQALEKALQLVRDTRALARSEAAEAGLLYYGLAQSAAGRIPELEVEVREMRAFLATGPRRGRAPEPNPAPAPEPSPAPPNG
jgi:hypothetical protein